MKASSIFLNLPKLEERKRGELETEICKYFKQKAASENIFKNNWEVFRILRLEFMPKFTKKVKSIAICYEFCKIDNSKCFVVIFAHQVKKAKWIQK